MDKIIFKKEYKDGLFICLHVDNSSYGGIKALNNQPSLYPFQKEIDVVVYKDTFFNYLALAEFCCVKFYKYCTATFYSKKQ